MNEIFINLGNNQHKIEGFINLAIGQVGDLYLDITQGLPFAENSVRAIYSENFIEHLSQADGVNFLRECRRITAPNGIVRIVTTDLDTIVEDYHSNKIHPNWERFEIGWISNRCEMLNYTLRECKHNWLYNEEDLMRIGELSGLKFYKRYSTGESDYDFLQGLESHEGSQLILEFIKSRPISVDPKPLVSVLIPAYRDEFFREALESAIFQTYQNLEIIICDDSLVSDIQSISNECSAHDSRIQYYRNEPHIGSRANFLKCFSLAHGDYIKFLNDDDLLAPNCIYEMLQCLIAYPDVTLVTSYRNRIDSKGHLLEEEILNERPISEDGIINGISMANWMLTHRTNFIGEPTTVMFRRDDIKNNHPIIFSFAGRQCFGYIDVTMWTYLLSKGDGIYITHPLSEFRIHPNQEQRSDSVIAKGIKAWEQIILDAKRMGFLDSQRSLLLSSRPLPIPKPWWSEELFDYVIKAGEYVSAQLFDKAIEELRNASAIERSDPWFLTTLGTLRQNLNPMDNGFDSFRAALNINPNYSPAILGLVSIYLQNGDLNSIEELLISCKDINLRDFISHQLISCLKDGYKGKDTVLIENQTMLGYIDAISFTDAKFLNIRGWVISTDPSPIFLHAIIDNRHFWGKTTRHIRGDVNLTFPDLCQVNLKSGFNMDIEVDLLIKGLHEIRILARQVGSFKTIAVSNITID